MACLVAVMRVPVMFPMSAACNQLQDHCVSLHKINWALELMKCQFLNLNSDSNQCVALSSALCYGACVLYVCALTCNISIISWQHSVDIRSHSSECGNRQQIMQSMLLSTDFVFGCCLCQSHWHADTPVLTPSCTQSGVKSDVLNQTQRATAQAKALT